ncbi:unnamed protein product [Protopolystoma xenopodis]|uniref:Uncharacterized protein n=1 Tax=Protopolystoma xenopodis TaxID=117903 RepID=A0A448XGB1_9PLAT|nr:unnamed protein product [Protopolystoma xenopodis]
MLDSRNRTTNSLHCTRPGSYPLTVNQPHSLQTGLSLLLNPPDSAALMLHLRSEITYLNRSQVESPDSQLSNNQDASATSS